MPSLPSNINATPRQMHALPTHNITTAKSDLTIRTMISALGNAPDPPEMHASNQHKVSFRPHLTLTTQVGDARPRQHDQHDSGRALISPKVEVQKRKKGSGVFGFLALKEPSTSAWEDYAEQQRKQSARRGGRVTTVGMPGVSMQKLPSNVPKVNSKWDGLPESPQPRGVQHRETDDSRRSTTSWSLPRSSGVSSESDSRRTLTSVKDRHSPSRPSTSRQRPNQRKSTSKALQPEVYTEKTQLTFLLPPSPVLSPTVSHGITNMDSFYLERSPESICSTPLPELDPLTPSPNSTTDVTTMFPKKDIEYLLPGEDEFVTSWIDLSEDTNTRISHKPSKQEAQILNNTPLMSSSYLDVAHVQENPPRMLGHQTRTPSASSAGSTYTADSISSSNSSAQPSLFSNSPSIITTPSTNASSVTLHASSQPSPFSNSPLHCHPPAGASPVTVSAKQSRSLRDKVKKSEILPWEMYEPSDRE